MKTLKRALALAPLALGVAALSACGSQIPEATEIYPKTKEALQNATSVAIVGEVDQAGSSMAIDMAGSRDGSNQLAKITQDGAEMSLLTADGKAYLKASKEFWAANAGEQAAELFSSMAGDKWISVSDASQFGGLDAGTLLDTFVEEGPNDEELAALTEKTQEELEGAKAYKYSSDKGSIWIAAEGDPHLLQIEGFKDAGSEDGGTVKFSDWNEVEPQVAPGEDEVITIPGL